MFSCSFCKICSVNHIPDIETNIKADIGRYFWGILFLKLHTVFSRRKCKKSYVQSGYPPLMENIRLLTCTHMHIVRKIRSVGVSFDSTRGTLWAGGDEGNMQKLFGQSPDKSER
jgi:hypothetical protein